MVIDPDLFRLVRGLLTELASTDVVEFVYETSETKLLIRKGIGAPIAAPAPAASSPPPPPVQPSEPDAAQLISPLTGVFYRSPKPDIPPFVQEGEYVEAGTVVGLIEAMKVFNEIRVEEPCRIRKFLHANGALVYKNQPLLAFDKE